MSIGVVWVQFEGASVFSLGLGPVPLFLQHVRQEDMSFGKVGIEFQRFSGCADYFRAGLFRRGAEKNQAESGICVCQAYVSGSKCRVSLYRLLEITYALLDLGSALALG